MKKKTKTNKNLYFIINLKVYPHKKLIEWIHLDNSIYYEASADIQAFEDLCTRLLKIYEEEN